MENDQSEMDCFVFVSREDGKEDLNLEKEKSEVIMPSDCKIDKEESSMNLELSNKMESVNSSSEGKTNDRIFRNVKLIAFKLNENNIVLELHLENSQELQPGRLLKLVSNDFSTSISATVEANQNFPEDRVFIKMIDQTLITSDMINCDYILIETNLHVDTQRRCVNTSQITKEVNFPFENYFIKTENLIKLAYYLKNEPILKYGDLLLPTNPDEIWPSSKDLEIDESQFDALKCALTQKFFIIKGAPGTGKTYVVSKIIQILLENEEHWRKYGSLVVLCVTKYSLEKYLENVVSQTEALVYIESETDNKNLRAHLLSEKYRQLGEMEDTESHLFLEKKREIENVLRDIKKYCLIIECLKTLDIIVPLDCLFDDIFLKRFKSNEEFFCSLTGIRTESLSEYLSLHKDSSRSSDLIAKSNKYFSENPMYLDVDLIFDFEIKSICSIFSLNYFEEKIATIKKKVENLKEEEALDDLAALEEELQIVTQEKHFLQQQLSKHPRVNSSYTTDNPHWIKYWKLIKSSLELATKKKLELENIYLHKKLEFDKIMLKQNLKIFREQMVIGLTLSNAQKVKSLLGELGASIVIVEEAEQIEEEIIYSLTRDCQHLILIENQRFDSELSSTWKTTFDLPTFEKNCKSLTRQYRMQPRIGRVFASIFDQKFNEYETCDIVVPGLPDNIFFIDRSPTGNVTNNHEVKYVIEFCKYLSKQGYNHDDVLILCHTNEQLILFKNEISKDEILKENWICSINDCSALEAEIVILILEQNVDSTDIKRLFYTALSRASIGLYIIGNMDGLCSKNAFWLKVKEVFEKENCIGQTLRIRCKNHSDQNIKGLDLDPFSCQIMDEVMFSSCKHKIKKPCGIPIEGFTCPLDCILRLNCGHACTQKCHANSDPDHLEVKCTKKCLKMNLGCNNHPCMKLCYEDCQPCNIIVNKTRFCGHVFENVQCCENIDDYCCEQPCERLLSCGHIKCPLKCSDDCGGCQKIVEKQSSCGHVVKVKCCEKATPDLCDSKCSKPLPCQHLCANKCRDPCTEKCKIMVPLTEAGVCGHVFPVPCHLLKDSKRNLVKYCLEPCNVTLSCGHVCDGNCYDCCQGRFHVCTTECQNVLICGHRCKIPCDKECQPCTLPCELKCRHSICNKSCGEPCIPCGEICEYGCEHKRCTRLCYELCDIEPCQKPCNKILKCNHACIGFCGDPCPLLCKICNEDQVKEVFFGNENDPNARYILLPDCGHIMESEGFLKYITDFSSNSGVQLIRCPKCRVPINTCMRVMNHVKKSLADYEEVKKKIFFNGEENLEAKNSEYFEIIRKLEDEPVVKEFELVSKYLLLLKENNDKRQQRNEPLSFCKINALKVILEIVTETVDTLKLLTTHSSDTDVQLFVEYGLYNVIIYLPLELRFTNQLLENIQLELRRLALQVELCNLSSASLKIFHEKFTQQQKPVLVKTLFGVQKFTSDIEEEALKIINDSKTLHERKMIVKAMGFKKGHWYKCCNGHFYVIGECGGAMERAKCIECDATVGGERHRVESDNALASEMDGATAPAWPR